MLYVINDFKNLLHYNVFHELTYVWGGVLMPVKIVEVDTINASSLILMENLTSSGKRTIVTANEVLAL